MGIAGKYKLIINSPMGDRKVEMILKTEGDVLSGSFELMGKKVEFTGGTVDGNKFHSPLKFEMPGGFMDGSIEGTVDGDEISGELDTSTLGAMPFEGKRA